MGTISLGQVGWKEGAGKKILYTKEKQLKTKLSCQRHPGPWVEMGEGKRPDDYP